MHEEQHLKSSDALRDIVIGMSDGLTVPFALAAGLSGAVNSTDIIVIAGIAEIAAGSIAMGLGGYLARKTTKSALNIGLSYVVGGLVTLSPYFFIDIPIQPLKISVGVTLGCLFVFGYFKSRFTGVNPVGGAIRVTLIGAVAAAAAFGVAKLFD